MPSTMLILAVNAINRVHRTRGSFLAWMNCAERTTNVVILSEKFVALVSSMNWMSDDDGI